MMAIADQKHVNYDNEIELIEIFVTEMQEQDQIRQTKRILTVT